MRKLTEAELLRLSDKELDEEVIGDFFDKYINSSPETGRNQLEIPLDYP
jgi:hypothetical protein